MIINKIKAYLAEPIIKWILFLVLLLVFTSSVVLYTEYHSEYHYAKPTKIKIANQNNKEKLAHIIKRELLQIDIRYRAILLTRNRKHIQFLLKKVEESIEHAQTVLPILQNGGTITDVQLVNFYDKDEIKEEISYFKPKDEHISVDVVNLSPKLAELKQFVNKSFSLLMVDFSKENIKYLSHNYQLILIIKQTEALLLRSWESANKISYDIRQANIASEKQLNRTQEIVKKIVFTIYIGTRLLVIAFAIVIILKIFTLRKNQRETEAKNKRLSTVVEQSPSSIVITDIEGNIEYVNSCFENNTGYIRNEIIGQPRNILKNGEIPDEIFKEMWELITSGDTWRGELSNKRKDGSLIYEDTIVSPVFNDKEEIINFTIIKLDVTEKIEMLEKIEQANESLSTIIDSIPVGVILINSDKEIVQINEQAPKILRYSNFSQAREEMIGKKCFNCFCNTESDQCPILDLGETEILFSEKSLITEPRDEPLFVLKSVISIKLNNEPLLMEVFVDISERKQYELKLAKHGENLECLVKDRTQKLENTQTELLTKAMEAGRAQLSAMILHNIGNAITPVIMNLETLKDTEVKTSNQYLSQCYNDLKNHKETIGDYVTKDNRGKEIASYMGKLINTLEATRLRQEETVDKMRMGLNYVAEILTLQQSYATHELETKQNINLNSIVTDAVTMQSSAIDKRNVLLTMDLTTHIPEIIIEKSKLMQVVVNLIKNSCDAIDEIRLPIDANGRPYNEWIKIHTYSTQGKIGFTLSDSGIGVEKNKLDKIFEFGVSTKGSSGFGLFYCKTFVESNQGTLEIESNGKGQGATITLEFNV